MSFIALCVLYQTRNDPAPWSWPATVALILSLIPWVQFSTGLIGFAGTAWVSSLYLLGLALALHTGLSWERLAPGQAMDTLFIALVIAAIPSTGFALYQWTGADWADVWIMSDIYRRPYANFAQANQFSTFLCWSLLALCWFWLKQRLGTAVLLVTCAFLLVGITLASSKTSWVIFVAFGVLGWYWRQLWSDKRIGWLALTLLLTFVFLNWVIPNISSLINLSARSGGATGLEAARMSAGLRPIVYAAYWDAALRSPWWGYGWDQVFSAQLEVLLDHPRLRDPFAHGHNLFLDFVLWMGFPVGGSLTAFVGWRFWKLFRSIKTQDAALVFMFLMAVAIHAMLELPLHYAYMLLPAGVAWGVLEYRAEGNKGFVFPIGIQYAIWGLGTLLLAFVIRDYSRVQTSYEWLRYEWANLATRSSAPVPNVILLTQWREFVKFNHLELTQAPSAKELRDMERITDLFPSAGFMLRLASAQALANQPDQAASTLRKSCQLNGDEQCMALKATWQREAKRFKELEAVPWP